MKAWLWMVVINTFVSKLRSSSLVCTRITKRRIMTTSLQDVNLDEYLQDTLEVVNPNHTLPLQQQHCKSMIRTLLGFNTTEFDTKLRDLRTEAFWMATKRFIERYGDRLNAVVSSTDDAPQFQEGMEALESFRDRPEKFFAFLARGRVFQGKFDRFLRSLQPELLEEYLEMSRETTEMDWLSVFIRERTGDMDDITKENLLACLEMDYAANPVQPVDGGRSNGKEGEVNLFSYLESTLDDSTLQILAPVWIIQQCSKSISKRCKYVVELPSTFDLHGMTSELDAVVVQTNDDDGTVKLLQVWEAKATLNPPTLHDILVKKGRTIHAIMENDSSLITQGQRYKVDKGHSPRLGIFGTRIDAPGKAAGKTHAVLAEQALKRDSSIVKVALKRGYVSMEQVDFVAYIEKIRRLARTIDPLMTVAWKDADQL